MLHPCSVFRLVVSGLIAGAVNEWTKTTFVLLVFAGPDNYVHRLVASKTDGKIVQYECEGDTCDAEKIDALQLEVNMSSSCSFSPTR